MISSIPGDDAPVLLIQDRDAGGWWRFDEIRAVLAADRVEDVIPRLVQLEARVNAEGLWAAGFISYEAAPAFDPAIRAHAPRACPLVWMGLFPPPRLIAEPSWPSARTPAHDWQSSIGRPEYDRAVERVRDLIAAGETYQANFTFRLRSQLVGTPRALFSRMLQFGDPGFGAYLECGDLAVCSASPELFFRLEGHRLVSRPMKGTAARGTTQSDDLECSRRLAASEKDRAENVMIVDMVRNDLNRVARAGSVRVEGLFDLERYPTLWQMTSTVSAQTEKPVVDVLRALFPAASITGAPKIRTTGIIADLEADPRGVYTGCIGYIAPRRRAQFNVAIRTAVVDRRTGAMEYGVGGGIVWDSRSESEYEECRIKARLVSEPPPRFSLLETMLWEPAAGYFLVDLHLRRLAESADYFGIRLDSARIEIRLGEAVAGLPPVPHRVRLLVGGDGSTSLEAEPIAESSQPVRLRLAAEPVDPANRFLYHKTTHRGVYERARATRTGCDDVILWNPRQEVTETTIANLVLELDGRKMTPRGEAGLLPGVFRRWLLNRGEIEEAWVSLDDLRLATRLWTINSVRKWRLARLVDEDGERDVPG
ncbi:MAG TPA: aminodeoxychorismate synthase component I [Burkholderiales bacterium]